MASSPSALDFFSLSFNAALALSAPGLLPPDPRAPVLDNVTACRRLLPAGAEGAFPDAEERLFSGGAEKRKNSANGGLSSSELIPLKSSDTGDSAV